MIPSPFHEASIGRLRVLIVALSPQFKSMFETRIAPFWSMVHGFDMTKFGQQIAKPHHEETIKDAMLRQWGEEGITLIRKLIGADKLNQDEVNAAGEALTLRFIYKYCPEYAPLYPEITSNSKERGLVVELPEEFFNFFE